jgi:hypothetical protein
MRRLQRNCRGSALSGLPGKRSEGLRCDARTDPFKRTLSALSVGVGLIPDGLQLGNAVLQHRVGKIGDAVLDGVVEPLELRVDFGRALAQFGDVRRPALGAFLAAIEYRGLRARHGGFGSVHASVQSETIAATGSPNIVLISANLGAPPWSSAASCNKAAIA